MKTKKLLFSLLASLLILFFSCDSATNQTEDTQNVKKETNLTSRLPDGPCPEGTIAVWSYEFESFHFHRPVKNCESGFWFCTKGGEWTVECVPIPNAKSQLTNNGTLVLAIVDRKNKLISFHFPIELIGKDGNTQRDFETFNVDEELTYGDLSLVKGDYPSTFTNNEIIINVPVK
jgi:hypothetical protein